ncbi:MAG TPA: hypothetical protein VJB90_00880 [Candidatus Nanoarchaeia archaeon]|nr:hypothetical protein [Candidatus Nanoarchaeia archaeon]
MAKSDDMMQKVGGWAFIVGLVIAVLAGVVVKDANVNNWLILVLGVLGLVVGFLNVTARESTPFLVAGIALVVSATSFNAVLGRVPASQVVTVIQTVLGNIAVFVAPAAVLVALRAIYALASSE